MDEQLRRDNSDRAAPWAGYGWKVNELLDRAQRAEAEAVAIREERDRMSAVVQTARKIIDPYAHLSTSRHGTEVMTPLIADLRAALAAVDQETR